MYVGARARMKPNLVNGDNPKGKSGAPRVCDNHACMTRFTPRRKCPGCGCETRVAGRDPEKADE